MAFYTDFPVYPTEILNTTDYPDQVDDVDDVLADLVNALRDEMIAVQAELGTLPKGGSASVKARLDAIGTPSKIQDADGDTSWNVEETADKDEVQGKVIGVEFFRGHSDGIITLAKQSRARVYKSATSQVLTHNIFTKIVMDGELYDEQNEFDITTNYRFTAKKAGYYYAGGTLYFNGAIDQTQFWAVIYKNGGSVAYRNVEASGTGSLSVSVFDIIYLGVNDYLEFWGRQRSGADQSIGEGAIYTWFAIHKLS